MVDIVTPSPTQITICITCKAKLSFTYQDMVEVKSSDYTGASEWVNYIHCPSCGNDTPAKEHYS